MTEVYAGALLFPAELGPDAVRRYRDWAAELPDEVELGGPLPAPAADPGRPGAASRPAAADDRRGVDRRPGRPASGCSRRCASSASRSWTPSRRSGRRAEPDPHGPRAAGPRPRRRCADPRAPRRGDRGVLRGRRAGGRLAAGARPSCASSAARSGGPPTTPGRSRTSTPSSSCSRSAWSMGPGGRPGDPRADRPVRSGWRRGRPRAGTSTSSSAAPTWRRSSPAETAERLARGEAPTGIPTA